MPSRMRARKIEAAAFPVARQVLGAARDRAVLVDDAGAADADHGREASLLFSARSISSFSISTRLSDGVVALDVLLAMAPQLRLAPPRALPRSLDFLRLSSTSPARMLVPPTSTARMRVVPLQHPGRQQVRGADQAGFIRIVADKLEVDGDRRRP